MRQYINLDTSLIILVRQRLNIIRWDWLYKLSFSVGDQGILSSVTLLINILIARWVSPSEYGLYGIAYSIFLFISGLHSAMFIEPMIVIGPSKYSHTISGYLSNMLILQFFITGISAILVWSLSNFVAIFYPELILVPSALAISYPFILSFWMLRKACYIERKSGLAFIGSVIYVVVLINGLLIFRQQGWIAFDSAFYLMALASITASVALSILLKIDLRTIFSSHQAVKPITILYEHYCYGRWLAIASIAYALSSLIYVPAAGAFLGLTQSGILRAIQNLAQPLQQIIVSLSQLLTPWLSQKKVTHPSYPLTVLNKLLLIFGTLGCIYFLALIIFDDFLLKTIYSTHDYRNYSWLLTQLGIVAVLTAIAQALGVSLRALENPKAILWAKVGAATFSTTVGLLLVGNWGLNGASIGACISVAIEIVILSWFIRHIAKENN